MRLTNYLMIRILFSAALALMAVVSWSLVSGSQGTHAELQRTASSVERLIRLQVVGFTNIEGFERGFPVWHPISQVSRPQGSCVRLFGNGNVILRSSCSGRADHRQQAPQWFQWMYSRAFDPGATIRREISAGNTKAAFEIVPNANVEIEAAWDKVAAVVLPASILIGVSCLTVWWAVRRALKPARAIMEGLSDLERGALDTRLGPFPWLEFDAIASASNTLAASLATSDAARLALSRRLLAVQEEERYAVARELHDEFGQHLSAINANAAALRASDDGPSSMPELLRIENSATHLMQLVRGLLLKLRPWGSGPAELSESLRALGTERTRRDGHKPSIEFSLPEQLDDLSPLLSGAIYRIVQEALTNALRHGHPSKVSIAIARHGERLVVEIADDGGGCDTEILERGFGVKGMRERANALGGRVTFSTNDDQGTTVRVEFDDTRTDVDAA